MDWSPPVQTSETYDIPSLKLKLKETEKMSDILFANIRSLRRNFSELIELVELLDHKFTAIVLNETWLDEGEHVLFKIDGYDTYSIPRNRRGGGVLIYIKDSINSSLIDSISVINPYFESLFINIKLNSVPITLGTVYRPPLNSRNLNAFFTDFKLKILNKLPPNNILMCGDFNLDLHSSTSPQISNFISEMSSRGFYNSITQSTRVHHDPESGSILSSTLIDHIWSTLPDIDYSFVLKYHITDHFPIGCVLNIPDSNDREIIRTRKLCGDKIITFQEKFLEFCQNFRIRGDVHQIFHDFYYFLVNLIDEYFPIIRESRKMKSLNRPWIDKELQSLISKKHAIYKKCRQGLLSFSRFKAYRNLLNKTLDVAKKLYYKDKFSEISKDPKSTWKLINNVLNPAKSEKSIVLKEGNAIIVNSTTLSDKFNSFYLNKSDSNNTSSKYSDKIKMNPNSFFLKPVTPDEVFNTLFTMKNNSIFSDIPVKILKLLKEPLCILLSDLFNYAISNNTFPNILKTGTITPIPKKGDRKNINNYRPITLLNAIAKIFDKILYNRVYDFFEKLHLFSKYQFGFMKNKGTEQATLNLMYNINQALLNNQFCAAVFVDLSKAFDKVNLDILLEKLYKYGFRGNTYDFFESYLKNRTRRTKIFDISSCAEIFSNPLTSNLGVAQGSNLGPLLFNIFINNLESVFDSCKLIVYADDILIFKAASDVQELKTTMEKELSDLFSYITDHDQNVNVSKTKGMVFSRQRNINFQISINNQNIEFAKEYKYLGLTIDSKLTFKSHIKNITTKVNQATRRDAS